MAVTRLKHATKAQQAAAYKVARKYLDELVRQYVPAFFQYQAMEKLQSEQTQQMIIEGVDEILDAAENVPHGEGEH